MKKIALAVATLAMAMAAGSAFAANSLNAGTMGLNVGAAVDSNAAMFKEDFVITGKYFVAKDMAVLGGFGLGIAGGDAKGTDIGLMAGVRKYMKTDDFAPFMGARFQYQSTRDSAQSAWAILGEAGAEYFLGKQFSLEGRVGFGYASVATKAPLAVSKVTAIGTATFGLGANFYF